MRTYRFSFVVFLICVVVNYFIMREVDRTGFGAIGLAPLFITEVIIGGITGLIVLIKGGAMITRKKVDRVNTGWKFYDAIIFSGAWGLLILSFYFVLIYSR